MSFQNLKNNLTEWSFSCNCKLMRTSQNSRLDPVCDGFLELFEAQGISTRGCLERYNAALANEIEYEVHNQIDKDVERTFGAKSFFKQENIG